MSFTTKTVEAKRGSESDTDFPDELENGNFRTPVVIKVIHLLKFLNKVFRLLWYCWSRCLNSDDKK